jgi:hypothetical protein
MKIFTPSHRLLALGLVLQYDSERQDLGLAPILSTGHRILINQERGRIMSGDFDYLQSIEFENKIESILVEIRKQKWKPENEIKYD